MKYKHYKGGEYYFISDAIYTNKDGYDPEPVVVYKNEKGDMFVRPKFEFYGYIEVPTPNGFGNARRFKEMKCKVCGEFIDVCRAGHSQV